MDCLKPGDASSPRRRRSVGSLRLRHQRRPQCLHGKASPWTAQRAAGCSSCEESVQKNLKVGVGLMIRHCRGRQELHQRIATDRLVRSLPCGPTGCRALGLARPRSGSISEPLPDPAIPRFPLGQRRCYSDYYIHQIDECSWMKDAWPVKPTRWRTPLSRIRSIRILTSTMLSTYPDGTKLFYDGRNMTGCTAEFASYVHGSKGSASFRRRATLRDGSHLQGQDP